MKSWYESQTIEYFINWDIYACKTKTKQSNDTTQYVLDTTMHKQTQITHDHINMCFFTLESIICDTDNK